MPAATESYTHVQYDLRPAKQTERHMLLDGLQILLAAGFPIRSYQYTGMGSLYFVDFIMFHRILGIEKLLSVESSIGAEGRVHFNRPFRCVEIKIGEIGQYINTLSTDAKHILWLDYDNVISSDVTADVTQAATHLSEGSILLVTVDTEPPGGGVNNKPASWRSYFIEQFENLLDAAKVKYKNDKTFAKSELPKVNAALINAAIKEGLRTREGVRIIPLFNFLYADGHQMLTLGCMIGNTSDRRKVSKSGISKTVYYRKSLTELPYKIKVPCVTRKERYYLDSLMPVAEGDPAIKYDLKKEDWDAYNANYRFMPTYGELLI